MLIRIKKIKKLIDNLRGADDLTTNRPIGFHPDFLGIAFRKAKRLESQGMRCIEVALEDEDGKIARIDKFGRVTWDR